MLYLYQVFVVKNNQRTVLYGGIAFEKVLLPPDRWLEIQRN